MKNVDQWYFQFSCLSIYIHAHLLEAKSLKKINWTVLPSYGQSPKVQPDTKIVEGVSGKKFGNIWCNEWLASRVCHPDNKS